ncbi:avidin-like [Anomaloglossus baeobatrachus]|uniref:avidin-like n=1 Tax=Anomaloglossus baeobatrachus TaxID=238106 RepID=UPI003F4FDDE8
MEQISALVVFLSCLMMSTAVESAQCNLEGQWMNDLQSNMTIPRVYPNGQFTGTYLTAVSTTNKTIMESPLIGFQQLNGSPTFGFTVKWAFTDSITVFTGQCFTENGQPILQTMWLLRSESVHIKDYWQQTRVGSDLFLPIK